MTEGKLIEYIDKRQIVLSVCLKDKGSKLQLLNISSHEVSISPKRALLISSAVLNLSLSKVELLKKLKEIEKRRTDYMIKVPVQDLWELTYEEDARVTYEDLAKLSFGSSITDDHISALVRALFVDKIYFKMKDDWFVPNSPEKIEQIRKNKEATELREREINEGAGWLRDIINNRRPEPPPLKERIVEIITQLALYGKDARNFKVGKEMFDRAGVRDINKARRLLVDMGIWSEDENLDLHRFDIRLGFSEPALRETETIIRQGIDCREREDLTYLSIFTIDGPYTKDFDDALSLETIEHGGGYRLGVHVTDLASSINIDGPLDQEAFRRGSSIYLPANQIPLLPPTLSNDALSLVAGSERLAISLLADFDKEWNLESYRFLPTTVKVKKRLTYDEVNAACIDEPVFSALYQLSQTLRQKRVENGAMLIPLPDIHFAFNNNSDIRAILIEQDTPAKNIVAECMILYNWLAAKFALERNLPILYRSQEPPQERLSIDESNYIYYVFQQRRKLRPLFVDTVPQPHSGLGVDVYTNATSPLRRYMDLIVQRQIHSALTQKSFIYTESEIKELGMLTQQALKNIDLMKRSQIRYWMLKYLEARKGHCLDAIVFQKLRYKYLLILTDFLLVADLPAVNDISLSPGEKIRVVIKKSDPWNDILVLELAD